MMFKDFPEDFPKALYVSDLQPLLYQKAVDKYIKNSNKDKNLELSNSDIFHFPVKEILVVDIVEPKTQEMLSEYDKPGQRTKAFSEQDEGFIISSITPFGKDISHSLYQHPNRFGYKNAGDAKIKRSRVYYEGEIGRLDTIHFSIE